LRQFCLLGAEEGKLFLEIEFDVMKHTNNAKRSRGRGSGKKHSNNRSHNSYESAGPEGKLRGSPQQILDKYLALARDALTAGDRIACEGYYQHVEHFYRVINADGNRQRNNQGQRNQNQRGQGPQAQGQQPQATQAEAPQPQAQQPQDQQSETQQPQEKEPQQELQSQEQPANHPANLQESKPQEAGAKKTRTRKPRVKSGDKPAEVKKIDIVAEAPQPDATPVQVLDEEKPEAAAS
jgi:hypothetical protein